MSLGNGAGFDHADPRLRLESGEAGRGGPYLFLVRVSCNTDHEGNRQQLRIGALASPALEIRHLLDDVVCGQTGHAGVLWTALSVGLGPLVDQIPPEWYDSDVVELDRLLTQLLERRSVVRELILSFTGASCIRSPLRLHFVQEDNEQVVTVSLTIPPET